jgi:hypothetical protein
MLFTVPSLHDSLSAGKSPSDAIYAEFQQINHDEITAKLDSISGNQLGAIILPQASNSVPAVLQWISVSAGSCRIKPARLLSVALRYPT